MMWIAVKFVTDAIIFEKGMQCKSAAARATVKEDELSYSLECPLAYAGKGTGKMILKPGDLPYVEELFISPGD